MDGTEHRFSPSGRLPGGDFRVRRQSCQQDGAEQQRERAAPPGHVCASAHGGVSGAQNRFAGADCPAGQPCRPADRRAHCPADCRAPCRMESVHVSPPLPLRQCMRRGAFSCGRGDCPAGACLLHPRAEPGRHWLSLPRGRGPSQTPKFLSPGPPSPWLPALPPRKQTETFGRAGAARVQPWGCKGRSPLHGITLNLPLPHRGRGWGG